jgi:hypothetical protein
MAEISVRISLLGCCCKLAFYDLLNGGEVLPSLITAEAGFKGK